MMYYIRYDNYTHNKVGTWEMGHAYCLLVPVKTITPMYLFG